MGALVNRRNIFENNMRARIYTLIAERPGMTIGEVAHEVGLSHPTVRYHLNLLEKNGLVVLLVQGNRLMLFRNRQEFTERERDVVGMLRTPEAVRVLEAILASPWVLRKELSEQLGTSRTSINWHLRGLMGAGLVAESREQGRGFLFVPREAREMLEQLAPRAGLRAPGPAIAPCEPAPGPVEAGAGLAHPHVLAPPAAAEGQAGLAA